MLASTIKYLLDFPSLLFAGTSVCSQEKTSVLVGVRTLLVSSPWPTLASVSFEKFVSKVSDFRGRCRQRESCKTTCSFFPTAVFYRRIAQHSLDGWTLTQTSELIPFLRPTLSAFAAFSSKARPPAYLCFRLCPFTSSPSVSFSSASKLSLISKTARRSKFRSTWSESGCKMCSLFNRSIAFSSCKFPVEFLRPALAAILFRVTSIFLFPEKRHNKLSCFQSPSENAPVLQA